MRPFLLLTIRAEDDAASEEYAAMLRFSHLQPGELQRIRLEREPLPPIDLDDWSGVILGGGPYNASDPESTKSPEQVRTEQGLSALLDEVVARDFPFLGCCYGIGVLGNHQGGVVDRTYGEPIGAVTVSLTEEGRRDPVFGSLPAEFDAFLGHKEAIRDLPPSAVRLAGSARCPVQAFRVGSNVYATQFHPELDVPGLCTRIDAYRHHGYFEPHEADALKDAARQHVVSHPPEILRRFVELHAR
ncbi:glutamine amidotransferase [Nocardioides sp.]|uniref:glutamine amidotransferase n=1 Tax=Nocardioides sp. TaxID=35761 RepID=UPI002733BC95|nr:glutamine amidotransferase [Nocardioides sp.]MDP3890286.1 glutamine amidotransferase [Nocardioides sp.]